MLNHPIVTRRSLTVAAATAAILLLAVPAPAAVASDPWITTRVRMALLVSPDVNGVEVRADTIGGHVTLYGTVAADAERVAAERLARTVVGVKSVRNLIQVVPTPKQTGVEMTDRIVRERVEAALRQDPSLADSAVSVEAVDDGVVVLGGRAESLCAHRRALEVARAVPGVDRLASVIESPQVLSDAEIWPGPDAADDAAARDVWITSLAKVRLFANDQIPALDVFVDTRDGVVTLFGVVPSTAAKRAAELVVAGVDGVRKVENQLLVRDAPPPPAADAPEDGVPPLHDRVAAALAADPALRDATIDVEVDDQIVRLRGAVDSHADRLRALTTARATTGVHAVVDELTVTADAERAGAPASSQH